MSEASSANAGPYVVRAPRRVIQIIESRRTVVALCNDSKMYREVVDDYGRHVGWAPLSPIPQD